MADDLRLIHQILLLGVAGNAGVDLVHLGTPGLTIGREGVFERLRPVVVRIEGNFPGLPGLLRETPAPPVRVGDGFLPLCPLLDGQFRRQLPVDLGRHTLQRGVQSSQSLLQDRFMPGEDRVEGDVLGDALQGDVGDGLVDEALPGIGGQICFTLSGNSVG